MSGDYSRVAFDPKQNFVSALLQQGRPLTDWDWNAQALQTGRRDQAGALDATGTMFVSTVTPDAFQISAAGGDLLIAPGRLYVDGLLAENHGVGAAEWDASLAEMRGADPTPYSAQPFLPDPPKLPGAGGPYAVYLDVWRREVTRFVEPGLVEKAVGVDATTRLQTVWQVKLLEVADGTTCATPLDGDPAWTKATAPSGGRLSTKAGDVPGDVDPCLVPPAGGYKGLENQLYRIEIHLPGPLGTATFKLSRENGSVMAQVLKIVDPTHIVVDSLGRDANLGFTDGDWIEILDDRLELAGLPGELRQIAIGGGVEDATRTITVTAPLPAGVFPTDATGAPQASRHTRIRRWDQKGKILKSDGAVYVDLDAAGSDGAIVTPADGSSILIENGVLATFSVAPGGEFHVGDHWSFAARVTDATVEELVEAPPLGVHHHYAKLAVFTPPATLEDCLPKPVPPGDAEACCCTIVVEPGVDIQAAIDSLPPEGGCVCLKPGLHTIRKPIVMSRNAITLHGETIGAVVRRIGGPEALWIDGASDPLVHSVRFEAAPGDGGAMVTVSTARRARLRDCVLEYLTEERSGGVGYQLFSGPGAVLEGCVIRNAAVGVWLTERAEDAEIRGCRIEALRDDLDRGLIGVLVERAFGRVVVENNDISGAMVGVAFNGDTQGGVSDPGAPGSVVAGNRIERRRPSEKPASGLAHFFGVDVCSAGATVSGNRLTYDSTLYGGVRLAGPRCVAEGNTLEGIMNPDPLDPGLPGVGVQIGTLDKEAGVVEQAFDSAARSNRIAGLQIGVFADYAVRPSVSDNVVELPEGSGLDGVYLSMTTGASVSGNRVRGGASGVLIEAATATALEANVRLDGRAGVVAMRSGPILMRDCLVENTRGPAVVLSTMSGESRIDGCAFRNCAFAPEDERAVVVSVTGAVGISISNCAVVDAGVSSDGATRFQPATGIFLLARSAQVHGNAVEFTDLAAQKLEFEDRALHMVGPTEDLAGEDGVMEATSPPGAAQVADNRFAGTGRGALVEVAGQINDKRALFGRVAFADNVLQHRSEQPNELRATVSLVGEMVSASNNHVRATKGYFPFHFHDNKRVIYAGNVVSAPALGYPNERPAPQNAFNLIG